MTILPLVFAKDNLSALLTPCRPYVFEDHTPNETSQLAKNMVESLYHYKGLGIAANQCGLEWSVFAMRGSPEDFVCFNPRIAMPGDELIVLEEGCLSFPSLNVKMKRPAQVRIRFSGPDSEFRSQTFTGLTARIVQHEINHLEGKMFFEGCSRIHLERAIRQAKYNKDKSLQHDYTAMGLYKWCG